jgi:hypothetical protein
MPEVFISNYMKQQRNFLKYKREVSSKEAVIAHIHCAKEALYEE